VVYVSLWCKLHYEEGGVIDGDHAGAAGSAGRAPIGRIVCCPGFFTVTAPHTRVTRLGHSRGPAAGESTEHVTPLILHRQHKREVYRPPRRRSIPSALCHYDMETWAAALLAER
jgi:hypothetical protein